MISFAFSSFEGFNCSGVPKNCCLASVCINAVLPERTALFIKDDIHRHLLQKIEKRCRNRVMCRLTKLIGSSSPIIACEYRRSYLWHAIVNGRAASSRLQTSASSLFYLSIWGIRTRKSTKQAELKNLEDGMHNYQQLPRERESKLWCIRIRIQLSDILKSDWKFFCFARSKAKSVFQRRKYCGKP